MPFILVAARHDNCHSEFCCCIDPADADTGLSFPVAARASADPLGNNGYHEYYLPEVTAVRQALVDLHIFKPGLLQRFIAERREYAQQMQTVRSYFIQVMTSFKLRGAFRQA